MCGIYSYIDSICRQHCVAHCGLIGAAQRNEVDQIAMKSISSQSQIQTGLVAPCQSTEKCKPVSDAQCKQRRHYPKRVLSQTRSKETKHSIVSGALWNHQRTTEGRGRTWLQWRIKFSASEKLNQARRTLPQCSSQIKYRWQCYAMHGNVVWILSCLGFTRELGVWRSMCYAVVWEMVFSICCLL